jgi:hypothetical protein
VKSSAFQRSRRDARLTRFFANRQQQRLNS